MTYFSRLNIPVFMIVLVLAIFGTLERKTLRHMRAISARIERVTR